MVSDEVLEVAVRLPLCSRYKHIFDRIDRRGWTNTSLVWHMKSSTSEKVQIAHIYIARICAGDGQVARNIPKIREIDWSEREVDCSKHALRALPLPSRILGRGQLTFPCFISYQSPKSAY